ncbi:MAG: sel1 repeat family protein [Erysipelotrichia bacterium]|nr:sel1 repeat family protein [Erysipelotrichia bacterium]
MKIVLLFFLLINALNAMTFEEVYTIKSLEGTMKALSEYKKLAKDNNPKAIHELGLIYLKGDGIAKNLNQAYDYFQQASDLGNLESTYMLGKIYLSSKTKYYNPKKAYNTFIEASNKKHAKSQLMIGKFLLLGEIVDKDYEKALYYFKEASKQKEYDANCYIAYMYASGMGVFPNFGRAHNFAKTEYKNANKLCVKVWNDYNLGKYPKDDGWKIGDYNEPIK